MVYCSRLSTALVFATFLVPLFSCKPTAVSQVGKPTPVPPIGLTCVETIQVPTGGDCLDLIELLFGKVGGGIQKKWGQSQLDRADSVHLPRTIWMRKVDQHGTLLPNNCVLEVEDSGLMNMLLNGDSFGRQVAKFFTGSGSVCCGNMF